MNQSVLRTIFYEVIVPIMLFKDAQKLQSKNRRTLIRKRPSKFVHVLQLTISRIHNFVAAVWQLGVAKDLQTHENGKIAWESLSFNLCVQWKAARCLYQS